MISEEMFNPALFLFLNPRAIVDSNVDFCSAWDYYETHSNDCLYGDLSDLPAGFNEHIYVEDHRNELDISHLNKYIRESMTHEFGLEHEGCSCDCGTYIRSINREAYLVASNTFIIHNDCSDNTFTISESNLQVGDHVKILKNKIEHLYATVQTIVGSNTFVVHSSNYSISDMYGNYTVLGIEVCDVKRLAYINYFTHIYDDIICLEPCEYFAYDPSFNPYLYRILYPDTSLLTNEQAFLDYVGKCENNEIRIKNVYDLALEPSLSNLYINHPITFRGVRICYISLDDETPSSQIYDHHSLITEKAIKTYVDRKLKLSYSNVTFIGTITFCNDIIASDLCIQNNACIENLLTVPRIALGECTCADSNIERIFLPASSNNVIDSLVVQDSSRLKGYTEIGLHGITESLTILKVNGIIEAQNVNNLSDYRLKNNIQDVDQMLEKVCSIDIKKFNFFDSDNTKVGFLAQDIEKHFPECIMNTPVYSINIDKLITIMSSDGLVIQIDQVLEADDEIVIEAIDSKKTNPLIAKVYFRILTDRYAISLPLDCNVTYRATSVRFHNVKRVDYNQVTAILLQSIKELKHLVSIRDRPNNYRIL